METSGWTRSSNDFPDWRNWPVAATATKELAGVGLRNIPKGLKHDGYFQGPPTPFKTDPKQLERLLKQLRN